MCSSKNCPGNGSANMCTECNNSVRRETKKLSNRKTKNRFFYEANTEGISMAKTRAAGMGFTVAGGIVRYSNNLSLRQAAMFDFLRQNGVSLVQV